MSSVRRVHTARETASMCNAPASVVRARAEAAPVMAGAAGAAYTACICPEPTAPPLLPPAHLQIFTLNRRVQAQNRTPDDFPGFIREGFDITVVGEGYQIDPTNGCVFFVKCRGANPHRLATHTSRVNPMGACLLRACGTLLAH